jgi:hypothetical protein
MFYLRFFKLNAGVVAGKGGDNFFNLSASVAVKNILKTIGYW